MRQIVSAPGAPPAIGPYSHAVAHSGALYCSGQIALDPLSGELQGTSAAEQARRCLLNLAAVCEAAGSSLSQALRVTVYMIDLGDFAALGDIFAEFFPVDPPARVTVGVAALPRGALVEIEAIVSLPAAVRA